MEHTDIVVGGVYQHFKGMHVKVIGLAHHTETCETLVIYTHVNLQVDVDKEQPFLWARPIEMFLSLVDKVKYPNATQTYRFELIG